MSGRRWFVVAALGVVVAAALGPAGAAAARITGNSTTIPAGVPTAGGASDTPKRSSREAAVDRLFAPVPASWRLIPVPISLTPNPGALRGAARSQRVVDVLEHDDVARVRIFNGLDMALALSIDRMPYPLFAAVALGGVTHGPQLNLPGLERLPDAYAVKQQNGLSVVFRRGNYLVTVAVVGDLSRDRSLLERRAVSMARRQERLIPPGATGPYFFPSTDRAIGTAVLLTTAACVVVVGLGRLRARRCRRELRRGHDPAGSTPPAGESAVDVSVSAARLRRMGLVLVTVQIVALNFMVVGILGIFRVLDTLSLTTSIVLVGAGLGGALGFTRWQRHRELNAIGPAIAGRAWRLATAGLAAGIVALVLLVGGVALAVTGLADVAFGPGLRTLERANDLSIDPSRLSPLMAVAGLLLVVAGGVVFRLARMWSRADARRLRQHDRRPSVLYLRSFEDDALNIPTVLSARRPFFELFRVRGTDTFEEAIAWELAPYGPVVAVGRPGRPLASLGAAREYLAETTWREGVAARMQEAAAIVVVVGATEGLQWELGEVVAAGHLTKTVFVFPPTSDEALRDRWHFTSLALQAAGVPTASLRVDTNRVCTAILGADRTWHVTVADARDEASYRVAIDRAMETVHRSATATSALTNT